jgi:hypothetical protein
MVLRGELIQRRGPAECNLLTNPGLSKKVGELRSHETFVLVRSRRHNLATPTHHVQIIYLKGSRCQSDTSYPLILLC